MPADRGVLPEAARQLADIVAAYREEHGLSQAEFGRRVWLSEHLIDVIESGKVTPALETLVRLARHLELAFTVQVTPEGATLTLVQPKTD